MFGSAPIAHTSAGSTGASNVTTSAIDTSGATLIALAVASSTGAATPTCSFNNVWTVLSTYTGSGATIKIYYCARPSTGPGHTFTVTSSGLAPSIAVQAWRASKSQPFDVENGAGSFAQPARNTGSITPSKDNALILTAVLTQDAACSPVTLTAGFTIADQTAFLGGNHQGVGFGYQVQSARTAVNPTWTQNADGWCAATVAAFLTNSSTLVRIGGRMLPL